MDKTLAFAAANEFRGNSFMKNDVMEVPLQYTVVHIDNFRKIESVSSFMYFPMLPTLSDV